MLKNSGIYFTRFIKSDWSIMGMSDGVEGRDGFEDVGRAGVGLARI